MPEGEANRTRGRELARMSPTPCSECGEVLVGKRRCPRCRRYFCDVCWNSQHFSASGVRYVCEFWGEGDVQPVDTKGTLPPGSERERPRAIVLKGDD